MEDEVPVIKQERLDDADTCGGAMQKVPSLSDLSDPESSLGEYLTILHPVLQLALCFGGGILISRLGWAMGDV